MGLLDSIRSGVSSTIQRVEKAASTAVEKVEQKAVDAGHAVQSAFEAKPSAPPPPAAGAGSVPPSTSQPVSAKALALNPAMLRNDLSIASHPPQAADDAADALIKKHTHHGFLNPKDLGNELKTMIENDPAGSAATLKAVMNKLPDRRVDDVADHVAGADAKSLRKLAETPDGNAALTRMKKELLSGWDDSDDRAAAFKIGTAMGEAQAKENRSERIEMRAAATYEANGHKPFNLNDPEQVKQLIVNSPQLDNVKGTTTDSTRCAGAAMLNGMLLAGDPAKNAAAIEATAKQVGVSPGINADEQSALDAMKKGTMTPTDAAHLQELLVRSAKTDRPSDAKRPDFVRGGPEGVSANGLSDFVQLMRANGAFANAKNVTFHAESAHWTVSVTNAQGQTTGANSFPGENGKSSLEKMPGKGNWTEISLDNGPNNQATWGVKGSLFLDQIGEVKMPERRVGPVDGADPKADVPKLLHDFSTQARSDPKLMLRLVREQHPNLSLE